MAVETSSLSEELQRVSQRIKAPMSEVEAHHDLFLRAAAYIDRLEKRVCELEKRPPRGARQ